MLRRRCDRIPVFRIPPPAVAEAPEVLLVRDHHDRVQAGGCQLQNSDVFSRVSLGVEDRYRFPVVVDDKECAQTVQRFGMNAVCCGQSATVAADENPVPVRLISLPPSTSARGKMWSLI